MLYAEQSGQYDVRVRFHSTKKEGGAILEIGDQIFKTPFSEDQSEILFKGIQLNRGDLNLQVKLEMPEKTNGP